MFIVVFHYLLSICKCIWNAYEYVCYFIGKIVHIFFLFLAPLNLMDAFMSYSISNENEEQKTNKKKKKENIWFVVCCRCCCLVKRIHMELKMKNCGYELIIESGSVCIVGWQIPIVYEMWSQPFPSIYTWNIFSYCFHNLIFLFRFIKTRCSTSELIFKILASIGSEI